MRAQSGWTTNAWPASNSIVGRATWVRLDGSAATGTVKDARIADVFWALRERRQVAGLTNSPADMYPAWYTLERQDLVCFKTNVLYLMSLFADRSKTSSPPAVLADDVPGTLARLGVVSNFFDRTPWLSLNRSPYGWDGLKSLLVEMTTTWQYGTVRTGAHYFGESGSVFPADWAAAKAAAEASYADAGSGAWITAYTCGWSEDYWYDDNTNGVIDPGEIYWDRQAAAETFAGLPLATNVVTAIGYATNAAPVTIYHGADCYLTAMPSGGPIAQAPDFSAQGTALVEGAQWWSTEAVTAAPTNLCSTAIVTSPSTFPPDWCDDPGDGGNTGLGFVAEPYWFIQWGVTNGFRYR